MVSIIAYTSTLTLTCEAPATTPEGYSFFIWGGRIKPVPQDWVFPRGNVKTVCDLFVFGVPALKIRPFRVVVGHILIRVGQTYFYRLSVSRNRELIDECNMY